MKEWLLLALLAIIIFISGCVQQEQPYKNDVITIEGYSVYTYGPYSGSNTGIDFYVLNNGDKKVDEVDVTFFDMPGFDVTSLRCNNNMVTNKECVFNDIEPGDVGLVSLELKAPITNEIKQLPISFSVSYKNSGTRLVNIPIVDGIEKKTPTLKFYQSNPSYGPILLEIQPDLEKEIKTPTSTVKEYWGVAGRTFNVNFIFKDVGTVESSDKITTNLLPGSIKITYSKNYLEPQDPCDFKDSVSNKSMTIPDADEKKNTLICNFKAKSGTQTEYLAQIQVDYTYTYEYRRTETFTVYPR